MPMWGLGVSNLRQGTSSLGCFLQDSCTIFGVIFILSLTIWLFQIIFLSVSFNIMSSKLESDVPQMAFSVSYLYICRWMPRFLTLNKAIFHLLFWFLGERTGVLFVQIQQYRNMQQCWAWTLGCLLLCLPRLLLWIRGNIWPSQPKWTFALTSLSIPKTLYLMKKKREGDCTFSKLFSFSTFPCLHMSLSHRSSLQTNTWKGSGEGNRTAYPLISPGFNTLTNVLAWFMGL